MLKNKIYLYIVVFCSLLTFACTFNRASGTSITAENQENPSTDLTTSKSNARATTDSNQQTQDGTKFKGQVGEMANGRFEMTLKRDSSNLSGSYFYAKSGSQDALKLRGKIHEDGSFTLQEFDASGKQTGEFKGKWLTQLNEYGVTLEGTWKKPNGKEDLSFSASEQMLSFTNGLQISSKTVSEKNKAKHFDLNAEYPVLVGGNRAGITGFNQTAKVLVIKEVDEFKKLMSESSAEDLISGRENSLIISYNVVFANNDLISINFLDWAYTGGAHGNGGYLTVNYDLANNRELKLADLFKPSSDYLETVAGYCLKDLQSREYEGQNLGLAQEAWADGASATLENYSSWNITRKGLMFTFDPYQVGPYAVGPQVVIVPYDKLRNIIKPDGILSKFVR